MKMLIAAMTMIVLSFGAAYAADDQMPTAFGISNIGPVVHDRTDWSAKGTDTVLTFNNGDVLVPLRPSRDIGVILARDAESLHETVLAESSSKGAAAGGMTAAGGGRLAVGLTNNWYGIAY